MPVLQFKGKTAVENYHYVVPHHTVEFDSKLSVLGKGEKPSLDGNLIIEGDNLLALKALLPTHAGRIKCIYIDPPYNTGNEGWVYNDKLNQPQFKEWIGQTVGKEGEDATRHDKWCCMMYPRLQLLRELLSENGVILVSIDDNEFVSLRLLMDEAFGTENFIASLVWEKTRKNDAKFFSVGHEYVVIYAKSLSTLRALKTVWREPKPGAAEIMQEYRRLRSIYADDENDMETALQEWYAELPKGHPSKKLSRYKHIDQYGPWRDRDISWPGGNGPRYDVIHPTTKQPCKVPERGWGFATPESMQQQIDLGLIVFREDHTEPPFRKAHLAVIPEEYVENPNDIEDAEEEVEDDLEEEAVGLQVMPSVIYKQSQVAVRKLREMMGSKVFNNPKDHEVIARLLRYCTASDPNAVFLDSFAGSGTTAHSVLALNAEDQGNRRFILVQQRHDSKDDEKKGFNICQKITAERVRRVIKGYSYKTNGGKQQKIEGLGGTFSYVRLGEPLFNEYRDLGERLPSYEEIAKYIFYTETSHDFDPSQINRETGKIGQYGGVSYYLLYTPNNQEDQAFSVDWLKAIDASEPNRQIVVYCEKIWAHREDLTKYEYETGRRVRPMLVPFQLK
ncbi:MAG: site-specific DNA-methyltransferase [Acidobacteriota bacterium]